jgi:alpha-beta hydrolase superfamily lysophospholipase
MRLEASVLAAGWTALVSVGPGPIPALPIGAIPAAADSAAGGSAAVGSDAGVAGDGLLRQGYLGLGAQRLQAENARRLGLDDSTGVWIQLLMGDSPAYAAGLEVDDVVRAVNGAPTPDVHAFRDAVRALRAGSRISLSVLRKGQPRTIAFELPPFPLESFPDLAVQYGVFLSPDGTRRRSIVTRPPLDGSTRLPAVLLLQDLVGPCVEGGPYNAMRELATMFSRRGYVVARFDRRGVGDSEGESYEDMGLQAEVLDAAAALDHLLAREDVDPERVFLFGAGTGGVVAALLADARPEVAGIMVFGSNGRSWPEYVVDFSRARGRLTGERPSDIEARLKSLVGFYGLLGEGIPADDILARRPEWREIILDERGHHLGRSPEFFHDLLQVNLPAVYERLRCAVLVLLGDADAVAVDADYHAVLAALEAGGNRDHVGFRLESIDHAFSFAISPEASLGAWQRGEVLFNESALDPVLTWLAHRSGRP